MSTATVLLCLGDELATEVERLRHAVDACAANERAAIVAWIRDRAAGMPGAVGAMLTIADDIEAGKHAPTDQGSKGS
jgi:hypothetical protein